MPSVGEQRTVSFLVFLLGVCLDLGVGPERGRRATLGLLLSDVTGVLLQKCGWIGNGSALFIVVRLISFLTKANLGVLKKRL